MCICAQLLSCVQFFVTQWTIAHQANPSMKSPGKETGVGCHFLLQGIFPTQGLHPHLLHLLHLLHWQVEYLPLSHLGSQESDALHKREQRCSLRIFLQK